MTILAIGIGYTGIYAGIWLGTNSPEEMKPAKQYLHAMELAIFIVLTTSMAYMAYHVLNGMLLVAFWCCFTLLVLGRIVAKDSLMLIYTLLGLTIVFHYHHTQALMLLTGLVFCYGITQGSRMVIPHTHDKQLTRPFARLIGDAWAVTWGFPFILVGVWLTLLISAATF